MEKEAISFCSSDGGDIAAGGRGRARLANALAAASDSMHGYGSRGPRGGKVTIDISEDVDLARVALPAQAGLLEGRQFMSPERAKVFQIYPASYFQMNRCPEWASEVATELVAK